MTGTNKAITEFTFDPRCVQTLGSNVAVGGLHDMRSTRNHNAKGLFAVHNRDTDETLCQELGELINNSISLYSEPGTAETAQLKAIICNNDSKLYFADIENSRIALTGRIRFPHPLNHASISPSRKTIVACGDTQQIYLCPRDGDRPYLANTGTGSSSSGRDIGLPAGWQTTETIDTWSEFGFSTGFHSSGVVFGVAFQPGVAQLFDIRNLSEPLTQIYSTRPKEWPGAFRCLKFSQGPEDLLFLSEQMGRVHIVDLRNFSNHQILMVPPQLSEDGEIGGMTSGMGDSAIESQEGSGGSHGHGTIQFYDDMLKSGEAFPLEVNATEVHQMLADHSSSSPIIFDNHEFPPLTGDLARRRRDSDDLAIEDEDMVPSMGGSSGSARNSADWHGVTPSIRRTSTSMINDNGIRDLRMDGVSLSTVRRGSVSGSTGPRPQQSPPPATQTGPTASQPQFGQPVAQVQSSSSSLDPYNVIYRGRRMTTNQMYNSLRYLTNTSGGSGSGSTSGSGLTSGSAIGSLSGLGPSFSLSYRTSFDASRHHHPVHPSAGGVGGTRNVQTERGVSGIAWTDFEGGQLVVGTDSGVGVWSVDQVARRTFPDYEKR